VGDQDGTARVPQRCRLTIRPATCLWILRRSRRGRQGRKALAGPARRPRSGEGAEKRGRLPRG